VTYALLGVLVLVHLYVLTLSGAALRLFYADYSNFAPAVTQGEIYRLLTSMFLHANLTHLGFNGVALYAFGRDLEGVLGRWRFGLLYLLGGLSASVCSYAFTQGNSVGASGAVFAIFGGYAAYLYANRRLYGAAGFMRLRQLAFLAVVNLAIGFLSAVPNSPVRIDNAAHLGGLLSGLLLGYLIAPRFEKFVPQSTAQGLVLKAKESRSAWAWLSICAVYALVLVSLTLGLIQGRGGAL
jgi:rhomboid protease GluP